MQRWLYLAAQLCRCDEKTVRMNGEMWAWDKQQLRREKDWMHSHRKIYTHTHKELRVLGGKCMCSNCICHLPPRNTLSLPSDKSSSAHAGVYCYFVCVCAIIWPSLIAMHPIPHSASYYRFPCLGATLYSLPLNPQNTIFGVDAGVIYTEARPNKCYTIYIAPCAMQM